MQRSREDLAEVETSVLVGISFTSLGVLIISSFLETDFTFCIYYLIMACGLLDSPIWDVYKTVEEDPSKAKCKLCKKLLARGSPIIAHRMTTMKLRNHLKNCHPALFAKLKSTVHVYKSTRMT